MSLNGRARRMTYIDSSKVSHSSSECSDSGETSPDCSATERIGSVDLVFAV